MWGLFGCIIVFAIVYVFIIIPYRLIKAGVEFGINKNTAKRNYESKQIMIEELQKNDYLNSKEIQKRIIEQDNEKNRNSNIVNGQNEIATAAINKTNRLRIKYPFANEDLFKLYLSRFPFALQDELEEIEKSIKNSNELNYKVADTSQKTFTMKDIENIEPIEQYRENPIVVKLYKIDNINYVIYVRDLDNGYVSLLNSNDYIVITKTINMILNKQKQLAIRKEKISSTEIVNIYDNVSAAIKSLRENGTITI